MAEQLDTATARAILREIAISCSQVSHLAGLSIDKAGDSCSVDALNNAIQVLTLRMGWLAEVAAKGLGEQHAIVGFDALDWLMPVVAPSSRKEGSHD